MSKKKNEIRMTGKMLHQIVKESIDTVVKEGAMRDNNLYDRWCQVKEYMGADSMLDELGSWLDDDMIEEFVSDCETEIENGNM